MNRALGERDAYLRRALARRRAERRDDLLSALIAAEEAGDRLDDDEIVTICELLLVAGNVTTTDLIGNGVWVLLRHPAEIDKLRADPSLIENAVEEILRFESPVVQSVLGAPLARLEARLAIGALLERFPHLRLADELPVWRALPVFRGLAKLRVLVAAP